MLHEARLLFANILRFKLMYLRTQWESRACYRSRIYLRGLYLGTPLVVYKGRAHYYGWYPSSSKGDFSYGYSEKGYIDHDLLLNWESEIFEPRTRDKAKESGGWWFGMGMNHTWIWMFWNSGLNIRLSYFACPRIVHIFFHSMFVYSVLTSITILRKWMLHAVSEKLVLGSIMSLIFLLQQEPKLFIPKDSWRRLSKLLVSIHTSLRQYTIAYLLLRHLNLQQSPINSERHTTASYSFSILQFPMTTMTVLLSINSSVPSFKLRSGPQ